MARNRTVRLVFLGGLHEVGKNMAALECGDDIIVIDCGLGFPELEQPGVEVVLPDISWLRKNRERIRGIFITHGHEDHIGALPFLLPELRVPVHASRLTAALIAVKLDEVHQLDRSEIVEFDPDDDRPIRAGCFSVTPFRVCHSIPDACGLGVDTPAGLIVFTGDFKFDPTPVDNRPADFQRLQSFGDRGVRLLVSDCVHVESPGMTPSERVVGETFDRVVMEAPGRVIVATFASLISRVQQLIDVAGKHGRNVAVFGRSLERNVAMAVELGYLHDPSHVLIPAKDAANLPDHRLIYVVTGSQGEPMAVLARIANGEHRQVRVHEQDTVVVSASPIPGNETAVFRIIDRLFLLGADVLYPQRALVHVSGHGSREDLRTMLDLTRPRDVIPSHGEARHMALYGDLAMAWGLPSDRITFTSIGEVIEITPDSVRANGTVPDRKRLPRQQASRSGPGADDPRPALPVQRWRDPGLGRDRPGDGPNRRRTNGLSAGRGRWGQQPAAPRRDPRAPRDGTGRRRHRRRRQPRRHEPPDPRGHPGLPRALGPSPAGRHPAGRRDRPRLVAGGDRGAARRRGTE